MKTVATSVRLKPEIFTRLNTLSKRSARTKSYYINEALMEMLEDFEDLCEAEEISRKIKSGEEKTYSLDEVTRELGL